MRDWIFVDPSAGSAQLHAACVLTYLFTLFFLFLGVGPAYGGILV